jgi:hypothetical protein
VCDRHLVLGQRSGLVTADNVDGSQCFHSLQTLAKDFVLLHDVGGDGQACCDGDRKALGDECHSDTDTVDNEYRYRDPVRVLLAEPASPDTDDEDNLLFVSMIARRGVDRRHTIVSMRQTMMPTKMRISFCRGVKPALGALVSFAMRPKTVRSPVSTTRPQALPETQCVPAKPMQAVSR